VRGDSEQRLGVLEALAKIQDELARLSGPAGSNAKKLTEGAAAEAAKEEQPDKDKVGRLLDTALKTAREGAEFAEVAAKLEPHVRTAASWLGGQWTSLVGLLW
jgi:hypothetical protein